MKSATASEQLPTLRQVNAQRRFNPKPRHIIVDLRWFGEMVEMAIEKYIGTADFVDHNVLADFIAGGLEQIFYGAAFTGEATLEGMLSHYRVPRDVARDLLDKLDIAVQRFFDEEFGGRDSANDYNFRLLSANTVILTESQPTPEYRKGYQLTESPHDQYVRVSSL